MNTVRTLLLAGAVLASGVASAQWYPVPKGPKNMEIGYSYCTASAELKYSASNFNEATGIAKDTSFTERITSQSGFGGMIGYFWPVSRLGAKSRLAVGFDYMYNAYLWEGNSFEYTASSRTGTTSTGSGTIEMALPVGADYKYGCDALADKSEKLCMSFGAGLYPSMNLTVYRDVGSFNFHLRPYVRAEFGVFAGICMKLRATYAFGNINYFEYGYDNPGDVEHTVFRSTGSTVISLIFMPFSWKYGRSEWR